MLAKDDDKKNTVSAKKYSLPAASGNAIKKPTLPEKGDQKISNLLAKDNKKPFTLPGKDENSEKEVKYSDNESDDAYSDDF